MGRIGTNALGQLDAVDTRQTQVDDRDVGPLLEDQLVAADAVARFTDYVERGQQRRLHPLAGERMILDDYDSGPLIHRFTLPFSSGSSIENRLPRGSRGSYAARP